jgi:hypothetical protein
MISFCLAVAGSSLAEPILTLLLLYYPANFKTKKQKMNIKNTNIAITTIHKPEAKTKLNEWRVEHRVDTNH